ncbi:EAL domain-containing response regulator [Thaumasiovibrio subtropicus]|uniref:EAL domain-containing response regulator n=1 Tax=Thaumasiovibrio subtropicus TaxID=1891207 RepID=UPI000B356232|nr:EAL domain-containing response regulator [Thaumasiovibrio subtropicus]
MNDGKWIVVIDDSKSVLMHIKALLTELGFQYVVTSDSPSKSMNAISRSPEKYAAVLTDLHMPQMDGMQVIRFLGEIGYQGGVGIISGIDERIVSLACEIAKKHKTALLGSISKPVAVDDLRRMMNKLDQFKQLNFSNYRKISEAELIEHICNKEVVPYYQPKLDVLTNRVKGVEVLARIVKPGCPDAILPGCFIPVANSHNLMDLLTMQLIEKTVQDYRELSDLFGYDFKISFNLCPTQLTDLSFPKRLKVLLDSNTIPTSSIVLEITEEFALKSTEQLESLNRLRMAGYGLSMDDYGTGFTNLQQLRSLPFSEIKIDRSLIVDIDKDGFSQLVVKSVAEIAEEINADLVAEGIEHIGELDYLSNHYERLSLQGFLMCTPKPLESLKLWYKSWQANVASA